MPGELLDAALIDGCGYIRFFRYVTLPLSRPILATVAVIVFVHSWNSYLLPLVVLNRERMYPWPLGIMALPGRVFDRLAAGARLRDADHPAGRS